MMSSNRIQIYYETNTKVSFKFLQFKFKDLKILNSFSLYYFIMIISENGVLSAMSENIYLQIHITLISIDSTFYSKSKIKIIRLLVYLKKKKHLSKKNPLE